MLDPKQLGLDPFTLQSSIHNAMPVSELETLGFTYLFLW